MSDVDGRWDCTVASPMGEQNFVVTVARDGDAFTGRAEGGLGGIAIDDGTVDGDTMRWAMRVAKPMPITLRCEATIAGDTLRGMVSAGIFGSFPISGTRIA